MTAFNINNFNAHIKKTGVMQNNKFRVLIVPLGTNFNISQQAFESLSFRAENVNLPGLNFELINTNRYGIGPAQRFPTNVQYTDTFITFLEDDDRSISRLFNDWIWVIFKRNDRFAGNNMQELTLNYKEEYAADILIEIYNDRGNIPRVDTRQIFEEPTTNIETKPIDTIVLKNAFPTSINEINLNHNSQNSLYKINVGISFSEWYEQGLVYVDSTNPTFGGRRT